MKRIVLAFFVYAAWPWSDLCGAAQDRAAIVRIEDVVYGRKFGTALTLDVFQPAKPNGYGLPEDLPLLADWFDQHLRGITK